MKKTAEKFWATFAWMKRISVCDFFILILALWTLSYHGNLMFQGNLYSLMAIFGGVCLFFSISYFFYQRRNFSFEKIQPSAVKEESSSNAHQWSVFLLILLMMTFTLIVHRPDADDSKYVNRAVTVCDNPGEVIMSHDPMVSIPDVPIHPAENKLISFEVLVGMLSYITSIPAIHLFHLFFAPFAALLIILAYRDLMKILTPQYWFWGLVGVIVFLVANGESHRSFGNFSFVRIHQGKGILLSVLLPLLIVYCLRFMKEPTWKKWSFITAAQIASLGMNSIALLISPVIVFFALLSGFWEGPRKLKYFFLGNLSSLYILVIAVLFRPSVVNRFFAFLLEFPGISPAYASQNALPEVAVKKAAISSAIWFNSLYEKVMSGGTFSWVIIFIVLTAWIWSGSRVARNFCLIFTLGFFCFFFNPFIYQHVIRLIVPRYIYWRLFWILPLPAMAGLTFLAPFYIKRFSLPGKSRYMLYFFILFLFCVPLNEMPIYSKNNNIIIDCPRLKIPPEAYALAQTVIDNSPAYSNVLVPELIALWLTTFHHHPYPLVTRYKYSTSYGEQFQEREALTRYIGGELRPLNPVELLKNGLEKYNVTLVCLPPQNNWAPEIRDLMKKQQYNLQKTLHGWEFWVKE